MSELEPPTRLPRGEHESKFSLRNPSAPSLERWLGAVCEPDPEHPFGVVSSLYYDTRDWRLLAEKENGDHKKSKVRVRWYTDAETGAPAGPAFLEIKLRSGTRRAKRRAPIDLDPEWLESVPLEDPRLIAALRPSASELELDGVLEPAFVVRYRRARFIDRESGARVALDRDIEGPRVNRRMLPAGCPARVARAVLEVKGAGRDLPRALLPLAERGLRREAFSKYLHCYRSILRVVDA